MSKIKTIIAFIASMALVATAAIAGTMAYLTSTDSDVNVMTLGNVEIAQHEYQRVQNDDGTYKTDTIDNTTSYVLESFIQDKALLPIVGDPSKSGDDPAYAGWDETTVRMSQVDSYGGMQVFAGKNAQDKFVTVENTGKNDAYVRTLVAIEVGSTDGTLVGKSVRAQEADATGSAPWISNRIGIVEINGNNYDVYEYVYRGAADVNRHVNGVLPAGDTTYPNLSQVYIKSKATNEDMVAIDGNDNGKLDILVVSQAVQVDGFADANAALDAAFGDITAENHPWINVVDTAEELTDALDEGGEILLAADVADDTFVAVADTKATLNLGGNTVSTTNGFVTYGDTVISNGTLNNNSTGYGARTTYGATTTYNDVNVVTTGGGVNCWGPVVWNGGSIVNNSTSTSARHIFYVASAEGEADGTLVINGGEFTFSPKNLTRKGSYICAQGEGATVVVNDGVFNKPSTRTAPIQALGGATVTIYGGKFAFDPSAFVAEGYQAVESDGWWTVSAV